MMSRHWPLGKSSPYKHAYPYKTGVDPKWVWDNESFPHLCFHAETNLAIAHDAGTKVDMRLQLWALRDVGALVRQHRNRSDRLGVTDTDPEGGLPVSLCAQVWWSCWQVAWYSPALMSSMWAPPGQSFICPLRLSAETCPDRKDPIARNWLAGLSCISHPDALKWSLSIFPSQPLAVWSHAGNAGSFILSQQQSNTSNKTPDVMLIYERIALKIQSQWFKA